MHRREFLAFGLPGWSSLGIAADAPPFPKSSRVLIDCRDASPLDVAFAPDGKTLAVGCGAKWDEDRRVFRAGDIWVWTVTDRKLGRTLTGHTGAVRSVAYSPDGKYLASGSDDRAVRVWDAHSGRLWATLNGLPGRVTSLAFSPDGKTLAAAHPGKSGGERLSAEIRVWEFATGTVRLTLRADPAVECVQFSPDGTTLAACSNAKAEVVLWDPTTGARRASLAGHGHSVTSLGFSPDGQILISSGGDWDEEKGDWRVAEVKVWDVRARKETGRLFKRPSCVIQTVAFSPDGKLVASGSTSSGEFYAAEVRVWDVKSRRLVAHLRGFDEWILSTAFSPDSKILAVVDDNEQVKLYYRE